MKYLKTLLKISVTLIVLALLFWKVDFTKFQTTLAQASLSSYILALVLLFILLIFSSLSIQILFKACGVVIRWTVIYTINLKSMFYSLLFPGDVAAGVARIVKFSIAHEGPEMPKAKLRSAVLVAMAADRILIMGVLILPLAPFLLLAPLPEQTGLFQKAGLAASFLFLLLFVFGYRFPWEKIFSRLPKRLEKIGAIFSLVATTFQKIPTKSLFGASTMILLCQWLTIALVDVILAHSLHVEVPLAEFIAINVVIRFARYIPLTLSGIGIREGLYPLFLQYYGIPLEKSLALGVLGSSTILVAGAVGGILEAIEFFGKPRLAREQESEALSLEILEVAEEKI